MDKEPDEKINVIFAEKIMTDKQIEEMEGEHFDQSHYKFIINEAPEKKPKLKREGVKKDKFRQLKVYNNPETDKKLKDIGNKGEQYIIEYE